MKTRLKEKLTKFIFLNKIQGPGDYRVSDIIGFGFKTIRMRGSRPLWNYMMYRFSTPNPILKTRPLTMVCYVNSRCNLKCPYCCYGVGRGSHLENKYGLGTILGCRDMGVNDFKKLAKNPLFKDSIALVLSGGEPLLNKEFFDILEYVRDRFPVIHLTTNGTLLEDKMDRILQSPLTHVNVSLDAANAGEYKAMRLGEHGEEVFKKVTGNIRELVKLKKQERPELQVIVSYVVGKLNYRSMGKMIELTEEMGADSTNFQNICGFNCQELSKQTLTLEDNEVVDFIKKLREDNPDSSVTYPRILSEDKSVRGCRQPFDSMTVDADGNIGPCSVIVPKEDSLFGNVFDEGAWNNQEYLKLRTGLLHNSEPLGNSFCEDCTFLYGETFP